MTHRESTDKDGAAQSPFAALMVDSIGGWRGLVDSGIPVVVFVVVNALSRLYPAIWSALGAAALILVIRLGRREPVQQALAGFFAVAVAALIAAETGQARNYFVVGIWRNFVLGGVFLASVLLRWPLVGVIWEYVEGRGTAWRRLRPRWWTYAGLTLAWAAMFLARGFVQEVFYTKNATGWLAATTLAMGYPLFALVALATLVVIRRGTPRRTTGSGGPGSAQPRDADVAEHPTAGRL